MMIRPLIHRSLKSLARTARSHRNRVPLKMIRPPRRGKMLKNRKRRNPPDRGIGSPSLPRSPKMRSCDGLAARKVIENEHNRCSWLRRMEMIVLIRALYAKLRGNRFEKAVKEATGYGKNIAYGVVTWIYAEPQNVREIWELVLDKEHLARIKGNDYPYPSMSGMIGWYKEPSEKGKDEDGGEDDDDIGKNDPRSKGQIIKSEMGLKDRTIKLARDLVRVQEDLTSRTRDYDEASAQATERLQKLTHAQEIMAEQRAEVTRLKALVAPPNRDPPDPVNNNHPEPNPDPPDPVTPTPNPDPPDPVPPAPNPDPPDSPDPVEPDTTEREQQAKQTLGDMNATTIDPKWNASKGLLGKVKSPEVRDRAYANRAKAYALLEYETETDAKAATDEFDVRTILWWAALKLEMRLAEILQLPVKPAKE